MYRFPAPSRNSRQRAQLGTVALCLLLLALAALPPADVDAARQDPPRVLVTIKPLHSLVAGVMLGVGEPVLLIEGGQSVHGFALRPSHARAIAATDIVFWVGPALEVSLSKVLGQRRGEHTLVALAPHGAQDDASDRSTSAQQAAKATAEPEPEPEPDHEHEHEHEHEHQHEHGEADLHPWLDPLEAKRMVQIIASNLSALDPANATRYDANAARLGAELDTLDTELTSLLAPIAGQPFVVFHDAYRALQRRYDLNGVGTVRINPQAPASAAHVLQLTRSGALCVFAEPQFEPALVQRLAEDTGMRAGTLDPLGAELPAGPALYVELMRSNARELVRCLSARE